MSLSNLTSGNDKKWLDIKADDADFAGNVQVDGTLFIDNLEVQAQEDDAVPLSFSGAIPSTSGTWNFCREGKWLTLMFPRIFNTATSADTITATLGPLFAPVANDVIIAIVVTDNGSNVLGRAVIDGTGLLTIGANVSGGNFTGAGNTGFERFTVRYRVA